MGTCLLTAAVAETLESLRESAGMTYAELAASAGLDRRYLEKLEAGHHLPGLAVLWSLARAFGLRPSHLLAQIEGRT
jgi:transcriptional regulator with XRE-family HTH domain